jgi:hypothetical protein
MWKRIGHNKVQAIIACFSLVLFSGLMALTNQYRLGVAVAVSPVLIFAIVFQGKLTHPPRSRRSPATPSAGHSS